MGPSEFTSRIHQVNSNCCLAPAAFRSFPLHSKIMFPKLPLLEKLCAQFSGGKPLRDVRILGIQHFLETTGSLIEALIRLGAAPQHIFLAGKNYSSNKDVAEELKLRGINVIEATGLCGWGKLQGQLESTAAALWKALQESEASGEVIVLDDGGFTLSADFARSRRYRMAGVEQTTSGISNLLSAGLPCPVVDVAHSAAKRVLESPLIEAAVLQRIKSLHGSFLPDLIWGVVGTGNVGTALFDGLQRAGRRVLAYDIDWRNSRVADFPFCRDLRELFEECDVVLGCSGQDMLAGQTWWQGIRGEKTLVSCSSHDVEFRTLLTAWGKTQTEPPADVLGTVVIPTEYGMFTILRGGCPVNFDGSRESVPAEDIQLTRALLLIGVLQAREILRAPRPQSRDFLQLDTRLQSDVALDWIHLRAGSKPNVAKLKGIFSDPEQVAALSRPDGTAFALADRDLKRGSTAEPDS